MPPIATTAGPVDAADLGRTLVHEHLITAHEGLRFQWPHLVDTEAEFDAAVRETKGAQAHGVATICDPSVLDLNRDVRLNLQVQEATGVRFVMATGVYGQHYTFLPHYFQNREVDALADCFVHDLERGIQGTPVRAHFLKCAADEPGITPDVDKVHRAVAQASLRTGAPIMAHTHPATHTGLLQMGIFAEEGVDPSKVLLAHTGDTDDLEHIEALLATGAMLGMDRYGLDAVFLPEGPRNATIVALCERGHADRLVIGQDACATIDWFPPELKRALAPDWRFSLVFERIFPALRDAGVAEADLDAMVGANVHRWLAA
jgi:phosphotriesterase-related protein